MNEMDRVKYLGNGHNIMIREDCITNYFHMMLRQCSRVFYNEEELFIYRFAIHTTIYQEFKQFKINLIHMPCQTLLKIKIKINKVN